MSLVTDLLKNNWQSLGLIAVGSLAFIVYILQGEAKKIEAASLIILQIEDLQDRLREISTYIVDRKLDFVAFYEALPLMKEDYWNKYKHYFVRKMSARDFSNINKLYDYVSIIQEQQELLQNLQKNDFFVRQNLVMNSEMQVITATLQNKIASPDLMNVDEQVLKQVIPSCMQYRGNLEKVINSSPFTTYVPEQIAQSLQKILREYSMLSVTGTEGYKMLEKQAKRRF